MPVSAAVVIAIGVGLLVQLLFFIGVALVGRPLGAFVVPVGWGLFVVAAVAFFVWWWRWSRETRARRSRRRRR
jgi:membrane protein implicated in regulation of membrane protease activity